MSLFFHTLFYLITVFTFIYASLLLKPRIWVHRMPHVVRAKVNGKTHEEIRWFVILGIPMGLVFFFYPNVITALLYNQLHHIMLSQFAFTAGLALWDSLILDLFIFCGITPTPMIIHKTTNNDYKDKAYHIKSGIKGLVVATVYSLFVGLLEYYL